jgi:dTDP-4-dehydrorhamnose 3,5-epimerase
LIHDVVVKPLRQIPDERGKVMHMLRSDSNLFEKFGEVYFSVVYPGAVKAWKLHREMTLNLAVPVGRIKLVLYDDRQESPSKGKIQEMIIGEENYCLVKIPPMIWNGFQGIATLDSLIVNCATLPHDPEESMHLDPYDSHIPYNW